MDAAVSGEKGAKGFAALAPAHKAVSRSASGWVDLFPAGD
jgi:hypothetical protein